MPTLTWIGKDKVVNHHQELPYRVLEHKYGFRAGDDGDRTPTNSGNKIIHGDNLEALKSLLPEYEGRIKCIYIDPPYNTGNEKWVYNDNVNDPKIKKWLGEVVGKQGEDLSRHDKWLCMMYPRLKLLHKLLADDGVIFISIDDNEQANLKLLCDEIFGINNFITQFIWQKRKGGGNDSFYVATDHEYILVYIKNKKSQESPWRIDYEENYLKRYRYQDEMGRYYYDTLSRPGLNNPIIYDVVCPDGSVIKNGTWQISKKTFDNEVKNGNVDFILNKTGGYTVVRKVRMPEGKVIRSIINDVTNKDAADEMLDVLNNKKAFSTPKPALLIEHLLHIVTTPNAIILDSFAGSGTTAHAVLNLNKKDGGNRKFILVEMEDYVENITAERVRRIMQGYGEEKNAVTGTGGAFDYYGLGEPIFDKDKNLNKVVGEEKIREYIYYTETKRHLERERTEAAKYLLDTHNATGYYFYYERDRLTTLGVDTLHIVTECAEQYVIYADVCTLSKEDMAAKNIVFKKIPRDIKRF